MIDAVVDAGPLIHLAELSALDVLDGLHLYVAPAVVDEVRVHEAHALDDLTVSVEPTVAPQISSELLGLVQALALDRGETESLALMELYPQAWFLTDDAGARLAAEQRGYHVHGTIGLLIRSVRIGRRSSDDILNLLHRLPELSTLYIRASLLDAIIKRLENEWTRT